MSTAVAIHEEAHVPQPRQIGKPGGFLRRTNFATALIAGIVTAAIFWFVTDKITTAVAGAGATNSMALPSGLNINITMMYIGWVLGFMGGIGAFANKTGKKDHYCEDRNSDVLHCCFV